MDLVNRTPYNTAFFNTVVSEDGILASVVCKPTFKLQGNHLELDEQDPWPVQPKPVETEWGVFDGELPFIRRGVDFIYIGNLYSPQGKPVQLIDAEIMVGESFRRYLRVFGDRVWEKTSEGEFKATAPEPFTSIPLTYSNAFGGTCECETGEMPWQANPEGVGYYMEEWQAEGKKLPNIEDPEAPIVNWNDWPDPVGTAPYPQTWSLRMLNALELDESDPENPKVNRILPTYFNNAHPDMIVQHPLKAGDVVKISHASPEGAVTFTIPDLKMHVHVQLEKRNFVFPMHLEQIIVIEPAQKVVFSLRTCFTYQIIPMERRIATVHSGEKPPKFPREYLHTFDTAG